jgi:hypothetical protein
MKKIIFKTIIAAIAVSFGACEKHNEGEQINTIELTVTDSNGQSKTYTWKDEDGTGGSNPLVDSILLDSGKYTASVKFLNIQNGKSTDITEEIKSEGHEHLICYLVNSITMMPLSGLAIEPTDTDKNGVVLGLQSTWNSSRSDLGTVQITVKHQPKSEVGTKTGDCGAGETDLQVSFPYRIR